MHLSKKHLCLIGLAALGLSTQAQAMNPAQRDIARKPKHASSPELINKTESRQTLRMSEVLAFSIDAQNNVTLNKPISKWDESETKKFEQEVQSRGIRGFSFSGQESNVVDEDIRRLVQMFPSLEILDLDGCYRLSDAALTYLSELNNLSWLCLKDCKRISAQGLMSLSCISSLRTLDLCNCDKIKDKDVDAYVACTEKLEMVYLPCGSIYSKSHIESLRPSSRSPVPSRKGTLEPVDPELLQLEEEMAPQDAASQEASQDAQRIARKLETGGSFSPGEGLNLFILDKDPNELKKAVMQNMAAFFRVQSLKVQKNTDVKLSKKNVGTLVRIFPNLIELDLKGRKDITDASLKEISKLGLLKILHLDGCPNITDKGIELLSGSNSLTHLGLFGCNSITNKCTKSLAKLKSIKGLNLEGSAEITMDGLKALCDLKKMEYLGLSLHPNVNRPNIRILSGASGLKTLGLFGECRINEDKAWIRTLFENMPNLGELQTSYGTYNRDSMKRKGTLQATSASPKGSPNKDSKKMDDLLRCSVGSQQIPGEILVVRPESMSPETLKVFKEYGKMISAISFHKKIAPQVTDEDIRLLVEACPNLNAINLRGCSRITSESLVHIGNSYLQGNLQSLECMCLSKCGELRGQCLSHLALIASLKELNIAHCPKITTYGLCALQNLKSLTHLSLKGNEAVKGNTLSCISTLTNLKELNISYCKSVTSAEAGYLPNLKQLENLKLAGCTNINHTAASHLIINIKTLQHLEFAMRSYEWKDLEKIRAFPQDWIKEEELRIPQSSIIRDFQEGIHKKQIINHAGKILQGGLEIGTGVIMFPDPIQTGKGGAKIFKSGFELFELAKRRRNPHLD